MVNQIEFDWYWDIGIARIEKVTVDVLSDMSELVTDGAAHSIFRTHIFKSDQQLELGLSDERDWGVAHSTLAMSNINQPFEGKPLRIEDKIDAVTYMRQKSCKHSMIKGACDDIKRCVHCGVSESQLESMK